MAQEILKNIYRISVPLPDNPLRELNSYLIKGKNRNLLIDTGFNREECYQALMQGVKELNVDMADTDILLTHLHSDHTGLAASIASENSKVYIHERDKDYLIHDTRLMWESQADQQFLASGISPAMLASIMDTHPGRKFAPDLSFGRYTSLSNGAAFHIGEYTLQVIETPGHTPGNLCLWEEKNKIMFTGDHVLFDITPNITCWPNMKDALGCYMNSLRLIRKYPVEFALPSHRATGDFHNRIDQLLKHHEFRLNECLTIVREEPYLNPFDIAGRMTWRIRSRNWEDFPVGQKWFAVGECMAHLDRLIRTEDIRREQSGGIWYYYPNRI